MMVSITPGIGDLEMDLIRNVDNLDENNSVIHSIKSRWSGY